MNWSIKEVASALLVVAILSGGTLSGGSHVWAQEKGGTLAQQIHGPGQRLRHLNPQFPF